MKMKFLLVCLVLIEAFFLLLFAVRPFVDRRDTASAVFERFQHPSAESEARAAALVARDERETQLIRLAALACALANGIVIYIVTRRIRRQSNTH
jgi:hypothetical protein